MRQNAPFKGKLFGLILAAVLIPLGVLPDAVAQFTSTGATQITVRNNGDEINGSAMEPVVSPNKEIYAFRATATHILNDTHPSEPNIYLYDPDVGFSLVSQAHGGGFSQDSVYNTNFPAISPVLPNGLYGIAFTSTASDLTSEPYYGGKSQVYLRIPSLNTTVLVSTGQGPNGSFANEDCNNVSVTVLPNPDRFIVAFNSKASNLSPKFGPNDNPNQKTTVFTATITLAETGPAVTNMDVASQVLSATGAPGPLDGDILGPVLSGDGKFIVVTSDARMVQEIPVEINQRHKQIFRFNRSKELSTLVSKNKVGLPGNDDSKAPAISFSGGTVAFVSKATNLGGPSQGGIQRILVKRAGFKGIVQANRSASKEPSNGEAYSVAVHPSGKFVSFADDGTNLTDASTNTKIQTYVKSLVSEAIVRTSETGAGEAGDEDSGKPATGSGHPALTLSGRGFNSPALLTSFQSKSANLTLSGSNGSQNSNIFLNELLPPKPKFEKKAPIEAPPDVALEPTQSGASGSKVTFTFQEFENLNSSTAMDGTVSSNARSRLQYHLEIRKKTGNRRKRFRRSRRNSATIRRLAPGRYIVRYRVIKKSGRGSSSKVESKSRYSPRQTIDIS
jgi:hypothetical protein